jgi:hypothetical protein
MSENHDLPQSPLPKVSLLSADCDYSKHQLKSVVALVEFGQRQARIELSIGCHVSFDYGLQDSARIELHQLAASLEAWVRSHAELAGPPRPQTSG